MVHPDDRCSLLNWMICAFSLLSFLSYLYIQDINLLSDEQFAVFCHYPVGCLLPLLIVSFAVQMLLNVDLNIK